jgi:hypothetical protein
MRMISTISASLLVASAAASIGCSSSQGQAASPSASAGCSQISQPLQDAAAFYAPGAAYRARAIEPRYSRQNYTGAITGAEVHVRATPGISQEYLERVLICHARGAGPSASPNDPLRPQGGVADVQVRSSGHSYAVSIFGNGPESSRDIVDRASAMVHGSGGTVEVRELAGTARGARF